MMRLLAAMREKNIPFTFLVGDIPTYKTTVQLKAENSELFKDSKGASPLVFVFAKLSEGYLYKVICVKLTLIICCIQIQTF